MLSLIETGFFKSKQIEVLIKKSIKDIHDLLFYFPRKYIDRSQLLDLNTVRIDDTITFIGKVKSSNILYGRKRRLSVQCIYEHFTIELIFFQGINYIPKILKSGVEAAFSGKLESFHGKFTIVHPEFEILIGDELIHTGNIVPIYKTTEAMKKVSLGSRNLRQAIYHVLKKHENNIEDYCSEDLLKQNDLLSIQEAIHKIHFPVEQKEIQLAKKRLAFDELLIFSINMKDKKEKRKKLKKLAHLKIQAKEKKDAIEFLEKLPFELTNDQKKAYHQLTTLAYKSYPFGALLQGDVGSGKTVVALLLGFHYIEEDIQVAFMAPTEILARQHYQTLLSLTAHVPFLQIELLLGKEKKSEKEQKLDRLKRGDVQIIIGTHSLIQVDVEFYKLGLVIIDEQHRFGVAQRNSLLKKGKNVDTLFMTATPIPRSLTLTLYGNLESILIKEKPKGRLPIETKLFEEKDLPRIYKSIKKYVDEGRQTYIIYPLIGDVETKENKQNLAAILSDYSLLENSFFQKYRLGLLHGRLKSDEKDRAMRKFQENEIQILVATTVVEVGVDVANANIILIRNAERFGLAQLHQLRGRVGRGHHKSFCILIQSKNITDEAKERLKAMIESEDGFFLAQKDLEIRGTGELTGIKQSGISEFRIADLRYHSKLIETANKILEKNKSIEEKILQQKKWKQYLKKGLLFFRI